MEQKKNYMSIGLLSKMTGVHIKSLRYYDALGILKPAYVDPGSGYRYYTPSQLAVVDTIQLCVELGIPLKEVPFFIPPGAGQIHYAKLIEHGRALADKKIQAIRQRLSSLEEMQGEMARGDKLQNSKTPQRCTLPPLDCWCAPFEGALSEEGYLALFKKVVLELKERRLQMGYEMGTLLLYENGQERRFVFVHFLDGPQKEAPQYLQIPGGEYWCYTACGGGMEAVKGRFPALFGPGDCRFVVEMELASADYDFNEPVYEIRCSL